MLANSHGACYNKSNETPEYLLRHLRKIVIAFDCQSILSVAVSVGISAVLANEI